MGRGLGIRVVGPLAVTRDGAPVTLPPSRKVRALLAYLALSPAPVSRSRLCDLLFDVPNDPRSELRWCLSKLRGIVDDEKHHRVVAHSDDTVSLDLAGCELDVRTLDEAARGDFNVLPVERLAELSSLFVGDMLEGIVLDGSPELSGWLSAQRQRYRSLHVRILDALAQRSPGSADTFSCLDRWLQLAPFDQRAHGLMLRVLVQSGRPTDADEHLARAIRAFEQEGVDWTPLRAALQAAREANLPVVPSRVIALPADDDRAESPTRRRASIAVMPFADRTGAAGIADGLTEDIIMQLAKLRLLFVIARGTVYSLGERGVSAQEAGRILGVEYVVSGSVRRVAADRFLVNVELVDTRDARIVWNEQLEGAGSETFRVLESIVARIVAAIAEEIETAERDRAVLKPPSSLDAWEAYHRGLWHMYKFNGVDNRDAEGFFQRALALDPTFSRAHAALSFTHFQNVFLELTPDRDRQMALAYETANASLSADDHDPAAHWAMGRALWLRGGAHGEAVSELERSVELSPNFALGHYTLGFVNSQSGDPRSAIEAVSYSRQLSPFDPLQFAMLASRALAHIRLDQRAEAAEWAIKATARPNAHTHILAIAASCLSLADRRDEARAFVTRIRERIPGYSVDHFLRAFRFDAEADKLIRVGAKAIDFDR